MNNIKDLSLDLESVHKNNPLIHCITNYVAMNFTANSLLAIGASPLMSFCSEEMEEIVSKCDALCINIGCLDTQQTEAMKVAVEATLKYNKPWVLDPVGVGISNIRTKICNSLIDIKAPAVIRGNYSEIAFLTGAQKDIRSLENKFGNDKEMREITSQLALRIGSVVVASGATDYISDGKDVDEIILGHPMMAKVTAMGCVSSAIISAFVAIDDNHFSAAHNTMTLVGDIGAKVAKTCSGNGTFVSQFIDNLYNAQRNLK